MKELHYYGEKLSHEKARLEEELGHLGIRDPKDQENWDVAVPVNDVMPSDENELADKAEESHIGSIVVDELKARYRLICHALGRIDAGTYGTCEISGEPIEEDRLEANPAARTCKAHIGSEDLLVI
jgi:RNA polymerase-binding transcription factor DksA